LPVDLVDFLSSLTCTVSEELGKVFDSPVWGVCLICIIKEVNQLLGLGNRIKMWSKVDFDRVEQ
jgi:hypothetical protein